MRVIITIDDTERGIYPVIQWLDNGTTDHLASSLSMNLAAQFAELIKKYNSIGALKVVGTKDFN